MSSGAFSIDQLMELAGLSVSQAGAFSTDNITASQLIRPLVYKVHPPQKGRRILVACGPGNNGRLIVFHTLLNLPD